MNDLIHQSAEAAALKINHHLVNAGAIEDRPAIVTLLTAIIEKAFAPVAAELESDPTGYWRRALQAERKRANDNLLLVSRRSVEIASLKVEIRALEARLARRDLSSDLEAAAQIYEGDPVALIEVVDL